jgi:2-oxoglutarate dehydrogenase E1 component
LKQLIDYRNYGFSKEDLDKKFVVDTPYLGAIMSNRKDWTLRELVSALEKAYCGKIGVEYMHIYQ